jgi:hypothetical protein
MKYGFFFLKKKKNKNEHKTIFLLFNKYLEKKLTFGHVYEEHVAKYGHVYLKHVSILLRI